MTDIGSLPLSASPPPDDPALRDAWLAAWEVVFAERVARVLRAQIAACWEAFTSSALVASLIDSELAGQVVWEQNIGTLVGYTAEVYQSGALTAWLSAADRGMLPPENLWAPVVNQRAVDHLAVATNRLVGVGQTTWADVRQVLTDGVATGKTVDEMRREVRQVSRVTEQRAEVIARTEVIGAYNAGHQGGVTALGPEFGPSMKSWLATSDRRTRPSHVAAHQQVVAADSRFAVGGATLEFPGDPSGPAAEVIQCRCTVLFYWDGDTLPDGTVVGGDADTLTVA
jgi:SPP1 gp7 family putative phage head morphogenesis protein